RFGMLGLALAALVAGGMSAPASPSAEREPGSTIDMPYLIAPVVVDGALFANAYVTSQIVATSAAATIVVRDKLPFIQDAFVRDVNAEPIGKPADPATVDVPALTARLLADAQRIVGPGFIDTIHIVRVQMSLLHPKAPS
ncbi:MAG TPA: hypothetical protein VN154_08395, partial [Rhizomicrobium sp.]|nr:hypothetical protein [Rhizomicrobium sp.]